MAQFDQSTNLKYFLLNEGTENERYFICASEDVQTPIYYDGNVVENVNVVDMTLENDLTFDPVDDHGMPYESENGVPFIEIDGGAAEFIGIRPPRP